MEIITDFPLLHIKRKEDYSIKLELLHYVAIDGKIIWPERRAGQPSKLDYPVEREND